MAKTSVEVDEALLNRVADELGTKTKKDTIHEALKYVDGRRARLTRTIDDVMQYWGDDIGDSEIMAGARR